MKLSKWITIYTALLGVFGVGMGIWSAISPMGMFEIAGLTLEGSGVALAIGLFAARNFAFGVLFLIVLLKHRTKEALLAIYISRFVLDILDTSVIALTGMMDLARILEQALFLVPVPFVIHYLVKSE